MRATGVIGVKQGSGVGFRVWGLVGGSGRLMVQNPFQPYSNPSYPLY